MSFDVNNQNTYNNIQDIAKNTDTLANLNGVRPDQYPGRTYKIANAASLPLTTSNSLLYTVTSGKTLWLTSIILTAINASTSADGSIVIKDNNTTILPVILPSQSTIEGAGEPTIFINLSLIQPLKFTSAVNIASPTGSLTISVLIIGYEE